MNLEINGAVGRSFNNTFNRANSNLNDLKNRAREVQREMDRLGREYRQGNIHQSQYAESTARLSRELKQLEGRQRRISALKSTFSNGMNTAKTAASIGAIATATAAAAVAVTSLNTAANFEKQMSKVSAVSGATGADFDKLRGKAISLSETTVFTATEIAEGMEYLALSGMKTNQILGSAEGLLNLAAAAGMDLGLAADITTDVMSAFGMKANEAGHAADVFAFAQANANTNVEQMGEAMKYAAPMANQMGWTIEETAAAMMKLADNGLKGSIAGQAFGSSVGRLAKPTKAMRKTIDALGISFFDANDNMKSLPDIIAHLEDKFDGLTMKQKSAAITTLFGAEAYKHWAILLESGSDILNKHTKSLENSDGAAKKMADTMVDNYAGSLNLLKAKIETAQIKFMSPVLPVFQDFFDGMSGTIGDNMDAIEKAGRATAKVLREVTAPFSTTEPIKPNIQPNMDPADAQKMINEYNKELQKYEMFSDMGFGEKVEYMLDTATDKAEAWLSGSGGEAMGRIFTQLGTIAGKAWIAGLTGATTGAVSSALEGNVAGALGLGAAAWMLGGGTIIKGAIGAGRWGKEKFNNRRSASGTPPTGNQRSTTAPTPMGPNRTGTIQHRGSPAPTPAPTPTPTPSNTRTAARAASRKGLMSKIGKVGGRALLPVSLAMGAYDIYKSSDKVKATGEATGGIAGGVGGAKLGAAIGTAIAPGIGTALGGLLGGAAGFIGGKWLGGKAVDTARGGGSASSKTPSETSSKQANSEATKTIDTKKLNVSMTQLATTLDTTNTAFTTIEPALVKLQTSADTTAVNMDNLTLSFGQVSTSFVTSFLSLKTSTDLSATNMATLATNIGQATGWISSISGIQTAANNVITALNSLKTRIENTQIPSGGGATASRRTAYE